MKQPTRTRIFIGYLLLFAVVLSTAYLQSVLHFNTYLALAICFADTVLSATFLFQ